MLLAIPACSENGNSEGPGHRQQSLALTPDQEVELGREAYEEILSRARIVSDGPEVRQVERVAGRIAEVVRIEPLMREINLHVADYRFEWQYSVLEFESGKRLLPAGRKDLRLHRPAACGWQ